MLQSATSERPAAAATGHLLQAISSQPMMADEGWLSHFLSLAVAQQTEASHFVGAYDPRTRCNVSDDGIALVRVHGLLVNRGPWLGSIWGMTSYEGLAEQLKRCDADPAIRHIVLDIDSGGGMVAGIWDLMPVIDQVRKSTPVTAIANAFCASAAYAIGCAAGHLYVNRSSSTGSIGVIRPHMDYSAALERQGVRATMFKAGRFKDAGSSMVPLSAEAAGYMQASVDQAYDTFVDHVARYRRMDPQAVRDTEARVFGAEDACAAGLACGVLSLDELLEHIRNPRKSPPSSGRSRPNPSTGGYMQNLNAGVGLSAADLASLSASIVAAVAPKPAAEERISKADADRLAAAAAERAATDARTAERARIKAITGHESANGREAAAHEMALTTDLTAEQAAGLLAKLPKAEAVAAAPASALATAMRSPANSAGIRPDTAASAGAGTSDARPSLAAKVKAYKSPGRRPDDE